MPQVNVTELRQRLPFYLEQVSKGEELLITVHGRIIARIVPERDVREAPLPRLIALRDKRRIGDLLSPSGDAWDIERGDT